MEDGSENPFSAGARDCALNKMDEDVDKMLCAQRMIVPSAI